MLREAATNHPEGEGEGMAPIRKGSQSTENNADQRAQKKNLLKKNKSLRYSNAEGAESAKNKVFLLVS